MPMRRCGDPGGRLLLDILDILHAAESGVVRGGDIVAQLASGGSVAGAVGVAAEEGPAADHTLVARLSHAGERRAVVA